MPVTAPDRKATLSAPGSLPPRAAAAVRTLPRTATLMPMNPVRPENVAPKRKHTTRSSPASTKLNATVPSGRVTLVAVKKISTARGTTMMTITLNWRFKNASAPSWIAWAISFILGVPWSAFSTPRMSARPERIPIRPATSATTSHTLSVLPRWKFW